VDHRVNLFQGKWLRPAFEGSELLRFSLTLGRAMAGDDGAWDGLPTTGLSHYDAQPTALHLDLTGVLPYPEKFTREVSASSTQPSLGRATGNGLPLPSVKDLVPDPYP